MTAVGRLAVVVAGVALMGTAMACASTEAVAARLNGIFGTGGEATPEGAGATPNGGVSEPSTESSAEGPELEVQDRLLLAYMPVDVQRSRDHWSRATDGNTSEWPKMLHLGEAGQIGEVTVTPQEIRIVPGRSIPMVYSPEYDEMVDAPTGSPAWARQQPVRPGLVMPPNASLVMVRIETDPNLGDERGLTGAVFVCGEEGISTSDYEYSSSKYRVSYPRLGEVPLLRGSERYWFGEYQGIGDSFCPESGWMYFVIPGLDVDPSLLWLEYVGGTEPGELAFWTLSGRP